MRRSLTKLAGPYADLPAPVWALFASNVVHYAGNFVWPVLTFVLTDRLGMSTARASLIVSLAVFSYMPGTALGGRLADRFGRKSVCLVSRGISAALLVPCAFMAPSYATIALILLSRVAAAAADPAVGALTADLVGGRQRARAVSLLYLGLNLGFAIGPFVAGKLYANHLPWIFIGDAISTAITNLVVWLWVPETRAQATEVTHDTPEAERPMQGSLWSVIRRRPQLFPMAVSLVLFSASYSQTGFALPLQAMALAGAEGPEIYGNAMAVNGIAIVLVTPLLARLTLGSASLVALGGLLYAVGLGAVGLAGGQAGLLATTVVWSVGEVLVVTHWRVFVADQSPSTHRARLNGAMQLVSGAGFVVGPLAAGALSATLGLGSVWAGCFFASLLGSALLFAWIARQPRAPLREAPVDALPLGPSDALDEPPTSAAGGPPGR